MSEPLDDQVRTGGPTPDFSLQVFFSGTDWGVAVADLVLTSPRDQLGRHVQLSTSGGDHTAWSADNTPIAGRLVGYKSAYAAMAAGLRYLADEIELAWARYAAEHGPGVR